MLLTDEERKIVEGMRARVAETYWGQSNYIVRTGNPDKPALFCLIGLARLELGLYDLDGHHTAMEITETIDRTHDHVITKLQETIRSLHGTFSVANWNDHPGTTREDVLTVLDAALRQ